MAETTRTIELDDLGVYFQIFQTSFNHRANYRAMLGLMQNDLEELHATWFANARSPAGKAWKPLAPSTVKRKGHATILVDTGKLKSSLTSTSGDSVRHIVSEGMNHGLSFGTSIEYSMYHQEGTERLAQREHVGINDETLNDFTERIADRTVAIIMGSE